MTKKNQIKVLLYGYEYPPLGGGVGNALKNILAQFAEKSDLHIDFVTSSIKNELEVDKTYPNITFHRLKMGKRNPDQLHKQRAKDMILFTAKAYFYTWKLLLSGQRYDFSHFFGFPGGLVSLLFRWYMPYIVSLRGIEVPGYSPKFRNWYWIYRPVAWLCWKFAARIIANSRKLVELAQQTMPNAKIAVITNGVDVSKIKPISEDQKFPQFTVTAGATILGKIKGLDYLVQGFALLNKEFPETRLKLIGSGDLEKELHRMVAEYQIADAVEFLGRKDHDWVEQNLPKFHVLCLPSLNEGMSNAVLEGLAAGLPLVLTDTGGTAEILSNQNGFTVEQKNSSQIYDRLRELYQDKSLRLEMGKHSRQVAERMSWRQVADQYYQLYNSILNK